MYNVQFVVEEKDQLRRVQWRFWYYGHSLVLDEYAVETRPSKRHGYKCIVKYNRLANNSHIADRRATISEDKVPLTDEVKAQALEEYMRDLRVVLWSEVPR